MPHTSHPFGVYTARNNIVPPNYLSAAFVAAGKAAALAEITARQNLAPGRD